MGKLILKPEAVILSQHADSRNVQELSAAVQRSRTQESHYVEKKMCYRESPQKAQKKDRSRNLNQVALK